MLNIMNYYIDVKHEIAPDRSVSAFSPICNPINCDWGKKAFGGLNRAVTIVIYQLHINRLCIHACMCVFVCVPTRLCVHVYTCQYPVYPVSVCVSVSRCRTYNIFKLVREHVSGSIRVHI